MKKLGLLLFVIVWFALFAVLILTLPARAHDFWIDHDNYKSPSDGSHCCGPRDCFVVLATGTPAGWRIDATGELIPYPEAQASEDGLFWRCKRHDGSRRCFFAPQPSS